jgi:hypothetical protein
MSQHPARVPSPKRSHHLTRLRSSNSYLPCLSFFQSLAPCFFVDFHSLSILGDVSLTWSKIFDIHSIRIGPSWTSPPSFLQRDAGRRFCARKAWLPLIFNKNTFSWYISTNMVDRVLLTFIFSDFLFLLTGGLLIGFSVFTQNQSSQAPTLNNVTTNLLLDRCPLTGMLARREL